MAMKKDEIAELAKDGLELAIDQIIENELAKDIPVVNSAVNLLKLGARTIPDYLFAKKLNEFFDELDSVSDKDKEKIRTFAKKDKNAERLSEHLLNSINKASDVRKAQFISCLFLGYIDGVIDFVNFQRVLDVVDSVFIDDLLLFVKHVQKDGIYILAEHTVYNQMPSIFNGALVMDNTEVRSQQYMHQKMKQLGSTIHASDFAQKKASPLGSLLAAAYNHGKALKN